MFILIDGETLAAGEHVTGLAYEPNTGNIVPVPLNAVTTPVRFPSFDKAKNWAKDHGWSRFVPLMAASVNL